VYTPGEDMQEQGEGHVSGMIRDRLCVKNLRIDEGSQQAIRECACMIYLTGSRNRKERRMGGVLDRMRIAVAT